MTYSQPHLRKPTPGQLALLKNLAMERGQSFAYPQTFAAAAAEIKRLMSGKRSAADRRREIRAVRADMARHRGGAASVRSEELGGYGSSAHWR